MFRPGRSPKDAPGHEPHAEPTPPPTPPAAAPSPPTPPAFGANSNSSSSGDASARTPEANSPTGARNMMNDGQPNNSRAVSESESLARDIKEGTLSGFVGNGTTLTGEANFKGMLRVDGHLSGRVSSLDGTLIVSTGGQVDANIEVSVAQIYGTVNGDIIATKRIELGRVAHVTGNIQAPALVIESGAIFEGSCSMAQLREAQTQEAARANSSAKPPVPTNPTANKNEPAKSPDSSSTAAAATATGTPGNDAPKPATT